MATARIPQLQANENGRGITTAFEKMQYRPAVSKKESAFPGTHEVGSTPLRHPVVALFPEEEISEPLLKQEPDLQNESERISRQTIAELERRIAEQQTAAAQAIAGAREQGRREMRESLEQSISTERQQMQSGVLRTLEEFRVERQRYFHQVEAEVVRLSLAIAERVLHREAQLDPMLLGGAVRVALDKLVESTRVVLRAAPQDMLRWKEFFQRTGVSRITPGFLDDPSLSTGECVIETELGTIELGIRAQLEEIEKGFFDLLNHRPSNLCPTATTAGKAVSERI